MRIGDEAALSERIGLAGDDLQAAAGGAAVCARSRVGIAMPGVKYHEGRWAALREVRLKAGPQGGLAETVAARLAVWEGELLRLTAVAAGADWIAYRTGGVEELAELASILGQNE